MDIAVEHIGNVHEQLVGLYHQLDRSLRCQKNYFVSGGPEAKKGGSEGGGQRGSASQEGWVRGGFVPNFGHYHAVGECSRESIEGRCVSNRTGITQLRADDLSS